MMPPGRAQGLQAVSKMRDASTKNLAVMFCGDAESPRNENLPFSIPFQIAAGDEGDMHGVESSQAVA